MGPYKLGAETTIGVCMTFAEMWTNVTPPCCHEITPNTVSKQTTTCHFVPKIKYGLPLSHTLL